MKLKHLYLSMSTPVFPPPYPLHLSACHELLCISSVTASSCLSALTFAHSFKMVCFSMPSRVLAIGCTSVWFVGVITLSTVVLCHFFPCFCVVCGIFFMKDEHLKDFWVKFTA